MKQKYKDSDLQEFYTKRIYCKGMPEYSELTVQSKRAIAGTLLYNVELLAKSVNEFNETVAIVERFFTLLTTVHGWLLKVYMKIFNR